MKRIAIYPLLLLFALCGCKGKTGTSQAGNVFKPGEIWPDNNGVHINAHGGGMLQQGDTYYWFGEHKTEGEGGNVAQVGVHCYSSKDLYNWKDEGIALSVSDDESSPIVKGCILERPKVIFNKKTGKYVMWFHLEPKGAGYTGAKSGVAVSEKVTGPYKLLSADRPNAGFWPKNVLDIHKGPVPEESKKGFGGGGLPAHPDTLNLLGRDFESGQMARDMNLFVDDDGKAYHIYASEDNSTLHISELTDDYPVAPVGPRIRGVPLSHLLSGGRGKNWRTRLWELIRKPLSTLRALMCCLFPASPDSSSTWETAGHRRTP